MNPTTSISGFVPPDPESLKQQFPQLEILELLGKGGMGAVYKARQRGLDRLVAVKILPSEIGGDPAFAGRFTREARALAKLSHQNIVSVFDFGQAGGQYYFIMEYVDGANLRQLIEEGSLNPEEALAIVPQICDALQFAHNEGIVHRDIKPENILVDKQGRVKIADFGLAKLFGKAPAEATLTAAHQVMGTLHYMAPEQMRGAGAVDHRADIYSLGVVFYEMLTGELPIGKFEPPSKRVHIDVRLDDVVLRALESEPERRYQRAAELKHDTQRLASNSDVAPGVAANSKTDTSDLHAAAARRLRNPMAALFVAGLAQLIVALALAGWLGATLVRVHATPATPQTSGDIDSTGNGMTVTVSAHPWRPYLGLLYGLVCVAVASTAIGLLGMTAAVWGSQLQMERFVRTACGLVCLPSPVWPFGLPTALVAFSALSRPNVQAAFAGVAEQDETEPRPSILSHWSMWTILGVAGAVLVMATSLLPWMKISIFGITQTGIGIDTWHGIVVCIAGGAAALLIAAFATCGGSRLGQSVSAFVGGLAATATAGYFAREIAQPVRAQATSTVTGDASLEEFGKGMADAFADLFAGAIQQRPSFGIYAAIACGAVLALAGMGHLVASWFAGPRNERDHYSSDDGK
jgi:predicted Ser/Thr protein kinase